MPNFQVSVVIENKPGISDPEGDTILNDLVLKDKNTHITQIRSGTILKICDELRIYNPLVSKVTATVDEI